MKILTGFMVLNPNGADRVTITYDEVDETGMPTSANNKESFFAMDEELKAAIGTIRAKILERL